MSALPDDKRMRFRIGINLGDVLVEGDDVYGDGVNIAARLQQLAEPGGILISGPVYDQVHNKLSISFDRLGPQHVKNVTTPVMSYRVIAGNGVTGIKSPPDATPAPSTPHPATDRGEQYLTNLAVVSAPASANRRDRCGHRLPVPGQRIQRPRRYLVSLAGVAAGPDCGSLGSAQPKVTIERLPSR